MQTRHPPLASLLADGWQRYRQREVHGRSKPSERPYERAQTALLSDDPDRALRQLEQAIAAGWRELYVLETDPYWPGLHEDPRDRKLQVRVWVDVE